MVFNMEDIEKLQHLFDVYSRTHGLKGNYIIRIYTFRMVGFGSLKKLVTEIYYRERKDNTLVYTFECKGVEDETLYQEALQKLFDFYINHGRDYITE